VTDEPTLGEVMRRLEQVSRDMAAISTQLAEDRRTAETTFVRKDVYAAETFATGGRVKKLEDDNEAKEKESAAFRRQVLLMILGIAIPAIAGLLLTVNTILSNGGVSP
jgi:hypothetical protein